MADLSPTPLSIRPRRLRGHPKLRQMLAADWPAKSQLVAPLFVTDQDQGQQAIAAMPGQSRFGQDNALSEIAAHLELGLRNFLLFGIPEKASKDAQASQAYHQEGPIQSFLEKARREFGQEVLLIADTCLCEYSDHGHCGVLSDQGEILNDPSLELLAKTAVSQSQAGADLVAPSDMMDGRVQAIRQALDQAGHQQTTIMSYAVKYASAYYGPFREAADSSPQSGDRKSYQMDPAGQVREALREAKLDVQEGADIIIVKPGLAYLDVLAAVAQQSEVPVAVYNVSGEYSLVKQAAAQGLIEEKALVRENTQAFRRAGADLIITYHAKNIAQWQQEPQT